MVAKAIIICASVLLVQTAQGALGGYGFGAGYGYGGLGYDGFGPGLAGGYGGYGAYGAGCGCGVASTGGGLPCASASPIPPVGVSVLSENAYEGVLAAGGTLPFLGTVGIEGVLPTAGAGAVSYGCGSCCGIAAEEGAIATGIAPHAGLYGAYGAGGYGYGGLGYGYGGRGYGAGCGCGIY